MSAVLALLATAGVAVIHDFKICQGPLTRTPGAAYSRTRTQGKSGAPAKPPTSHPLCVAPAVCISDRVFSGPVRRASALCCVPKSSASNLLTMLARLASWPCVRSAERPAIWRQLGGADRLAASCARSPCRGTWRSIKRGAAAARVGVVLLKLSQWVSPGFTGLRPTQGRAKSPWGCGGPHCTWFYTGFIPVFDAVFDTVLSRFSTRFYTSDPVFDSVFDVPPGDRWVQLYRTYMT